MTSASISPELAAALGELYDAALDPRRWDAATTYFANLFGGAAVLFAQDSRSPASAVFNHAGFDPSFLESYVTRYAALNVWTPRLAANPVGTVMMNDDVVDRDRFECSEWYNDWWRPQGLYHGAAVVLAKGDGVMTQFGITRSKRAGAMPSDKMVMLQQTVPHFQRAIRVHQELSTARAGVTIALDGLDRLMTAACVTDHAGRVLFANPSAERLLAVGDGLRRTREGTLLAVMNVLTERLHGLIGGAARTAGLVEAHSGGVLTLPRKNGRPLIVLVSPLRSEAAKLSFPTFAALVLVRDPDRVITPDREILRAMYGMTRAEAVIATALASGKALGEIASDSGASVETVRTHVKRAMFKTETRRQAELVAVVLRCSAFTPDTRNSADSSDS